MSLKIDTNFFLKMLNGEQLVDFKHKPLEDKETSGHQGLKGRCIEDMKRIASVAATN